jgi:membrane associated rhomboid family serine protease
MKPHLRRKAKFTGAHASMTSQTLGLYGEQRPVSQRATSARQVLSAVLFWTDLQQETRTMHQTSPIRAWHILMLSIGGLSLLHILGQAGPGLAELLVWAPGTVESGQIWRLVTHAFIMIDPLSLFFELIFIWFIVPSVEDDWGTGPVLLFFAAATAASAGAAILLGQIGIRVPFLFGPGAALLGFMYAFSRRNPDQTFLLFFVLPVQARWFVAVYVAMRAVFSVSQPVMLSLLLAELAGALAALGLRAAFIHAGERASSRRRAALTESGHDSSLEQRNARLLKLVQARPGEDETRRLLQAEENRTFDFSVCPLADFSEADRYCQRCEAYGHCLARSTRRTQQD